MNPKAETSRRGKALALFSRNSYVAAAFGAAVVVMLVVYFCFNVVPFGDKTVLRMDLYHQYGPLFAELYERITSGGSFLYSWNTGLGSSFLGNFFNYLASPLSFLVVLFGHENVPDAIAFLILLKAALSSASFAYYLRRAFHKNNITIAAFGVLYAFCGFFIAYYWNIMWLDAMIFLPLAILGIEQIINKGKFFLYCGAMAMTMITNFYMAFMLCIFCVLYFLVYYFSHHQAGDRLVKEPALPKSKGKRILAQAGNARFLVSGVKFAGSSIFAACIGAFSLVPTFFMLQTSSATSGTFPKDFKSYFTFFDFLANHLSSLEPTIRSSGENVLPNVYCGMIVVILVPLYLFARSISTKEKMLHLGLLAFLFASFNTNMLNYIWHGFHFPNDLPYRFSFMYSFLLLIMSFRVLRCIRDFSKKEIICAALAVGAFIVVAQKVGSKNVNEMTVIISILFVVIYAFVLLMLRDKRYQTSAVAMLLFCCVCTEIAVANTDHYSMDQSKTNYVSDLESFEKLKAQLDDLNNGFYRMELTKLRTRNDPAWYNYNGVSTFSSMASEKLSNLQSNLGMFSNYINSYTYNPQTPVYNAMFSLKYIVNNSPLISLNSDYYTQSLRNGIFTAYQNKYELPIAYCVDSDIMQWDTKGENPFQVQNSYFEEATGLKNVFTPASILGTTSANLSGSPQITMGSNALTRISEKEDGTVTVKITATSTQNLYLYVKSGVIAEITVSSASKSQTQNIDRPYILDIGKHNAGDEITVTLPVTKGSGSGNVTFYAYGLNQSVFSKGYDQLKAGGLSVEKFTDTRIEGSFTAKENGILYTSIPYDEGWNVEIDGQPVNKESIVKIGDSLLGVHVTAGTHTLSLRFMPSGFLLGIALSAVSLILAAALIVLYKKKRITPLFPRVAVKTIHTADQIPQEPDLVQQENQMPLENPEPTQEKETQTPVSDSPESAE